MPYDLPRIRGLVAPAGPLLIAMPLFFAPARPVQQQVYLPLITVSRPVAPTSKANPDACENPNQDTDQNTDQDTYPHPNTHAQARLWVLEQSVQLQRLRHPVRSATVPRLLYCWQQVGYDVHRLGADDDGPAWESLP